MATTLNDNVQPAAQPKVEEEETSLRISPTKNNEEFKGERKQTAWTELEYHSGFGNHHESEAVKGSLVRGKNNPQKAPMGLYAEQLSGTAFTMPKTQNQRSWLYKILPTVVHKDWKDVSEEFKYWISKFDDCHVTPEQLRWIPQ